MTYKVKRKKVKAKKIPKEYFREREVELLRKKYKGKIPPAKVLGEGWRIYTRFPRKTHRVNQIIIYKGRRYVVREVSKKGVYLSPIQRKNGLIEGFKLGRKKFVPEKEYSGKAVPVEAQWFLV